MSFSYNFSKKIKLGGLSPRFKILASRAVSSLLIAFIAAIGTNLIVRGDKPPSLIFLLKLYENDI